MVLDWKVALFLPQRKNKANFLFFIFFDFLQKIPQNSDLFSLNFFLEFFPQKCRFFFYPPTKFWLFPLIFSQSSGILRKIKGKESQFWKKRFCQDNHSKFLHFFHLWKHRKFNLLGLINNIYIFKLIWFPTRTRKNVSWKSFFFLVSGMKRFFACITLYHGMFSCNSLFCYDVKWFTL